MSEINYVQANVQDHGKATGWLVRRVQYIGRKGCPDSWFFQGGEIVIMEFKRKGKGLDPHQAENKRLMEAKGVMVHVVDTPEKGIAILDARREKMIGSTPKN